jgi:hypothetical protein
MLNKLIKNKVVTIGIEEKPKLLDAPAPEPISTNPDEIATIITESAVKVVGAIGAVAFGYKLISTACDIAKIAAKAKF